MPEPATIDDKRKLDNQEDEASAASKLRQERRNGGNNSLDDLMSLASGVGGMGRDRKTADGSSRDNLGRPVRPERPLPASRRSQAGGDNSGPGQSGRGGSGAGPTAFAGGQPPSAKAAGGKPMGAAGDLDSRLMAGQEEENKEEKNKEKDGEKEGEAKKSPEGEEDQEGEESWGKRINRLKMQANLKRRAKEEIEKKVMDPVKQGTNRLLKAAWGNLIDSFGLTLIYINMHVFLRWVFPDLFCKLGEEWMPKIVAGESSAKNIGGTAFGIVEVIGLLILDLIVLAIIATELALIVMIVDFRRGNLIEKAKDVLDVVGGLTGLSWGAAKALFDLLKGA
ncbi:MAG: hypothetical protein PHZ04_00220 [Patescibacteria group bacterium]|nr:hypothetical protein [Patescibacteria group bacterium]MDD5295115.1 hypothetical protein [Patescibacteria group bacterium]MDD5554506.1 hypothetical protein [Patescibacteria group bacterium]